MNVFDLVVFDLDGTLIDSAPDLHVALNTALRGDGRRPLTLIEVESIVGDGATVLVRRALTLTGATVAEDDGVVALTTRFLAIYEQQGADLTRAYAGVPETLAKLAAEGFALGVCTNKPERLSRQILQQLDLIRYFQAVIGGDSLNGIRKPDPRHLLAAVEALGGKPERTVMVGDSVNDVAAARALGVPVIVRAGGYGQVPAQSLGADAVVQAFAELPEAIARLA
ncbi:MAG: phosphoglycolate phosphatase [Rhodospirillales bacterium]|nr:phosphoglycolate phosphatase [Rhodospirillales bacterium]